ncbi:MAG: sigma-70 family RNA polymerase sigma factor [Deltaproteobacteria bacterium]|nr:sigma-70 family RNA polymerase sigma factor [Deltaproteobacteria bacterium]
MMRINKKREIIKSEFLKYLKDVYNLSLYLTRNVEDAKDLTQDTFARALEYIDSYTPNTNAKAYLFRIATTIFFNNQSRLNTEQNHLEFRAFNEDDGSEVIGRDLNLIEDEEEKFIREYSSREVERLLLNLSFEHRTILILADIEEFSYEEISKILNIPIGTVMSRLSRARSALKKELLKREEIIRRETGGENIIRLSKYDLSKAK